MSEMPSPAPRPLLTPQRAVGTSAAVLLLAATLITHWEGEDRVAKHNSFDPKGVITVCNGITNYDWPWLKPGMTFTPEQCRQALVDLIPKYIAPLRACIKDFDAMPPHRQAALTSAAYNLGAGTVCKSSAARYLNAGDIARGCKALGAYVYAAGKKLKGLVNRRHDGTWGEIEWCLKGQQ